MATTTEVKEKQIRFNGPMVRAILDGRKTETRRVVNHLIGFRGMRQFERSNTPGYDWNFRCKRGLWQDMRESQILQLCPYGSIGDRLWVRETYCLPIVFNDKSPTEVASQCLDAGYRSPWSPIRYEAYGDVKGLELLNDFGGEWGKKRPSIHMPRWASRITLEVTGVRVERLNEISRGDCMSEGCPFPNMAKTTNPIAWFSELWESINGEGSWALNPWVWVIEFKRVGWWCN